MWQKKGLVFDIRRWRPIGVSSHASIPFALQVDGNRFQIFYSSRNAEGRSLPFYVPANVESGTITIAGSPVGPIAELGLLGTFDDSGIMPTCVVRHDGTLYMYYIGWNPQVTVSYRLAVGVMTSTDAGASWQRISAGPVCDRSLEEPYFNTAPYVLVEDGTWRMWYISCTSWRHVHGHPEPSYHIKYAESADGVRWCRDGTVCLDYDDRAEALGRPCVLRSDGQYHMFFSYRSIVDYRTKPGSGYRIGKATSADGVRWHKRYDETGIGLSAHGWDSMMMEYGHVFFHEGLYYMVYNGNGFGKDGFGYAVTDRL